MEPVKLHCTKGCTTTFSSLGTLRRHMDHKHTSNPVRYYCERCWKPFCRPDVTANHIRKHHPESNIKENITKQHFHGDPRIVIQKPTPWVPPPEACTRDYLHKTKFRVIPAKPKYYAQEKTPLPTLSTLESDLFLSDSESDTDVAATQKSSSSHSTICLDENPADKQTNLVTVHSVYGLFT